MVGRPGDGIHGRMVRVRVGVKVGEQRSFALLTRFNAPSQGCPPGSCLMSHASYGLLQVSVRAAGACLGPVFASCKPNVQISFVTALDCPPPPPPESTCAHGMTEMWGPRTRLSGDRPERCGRFVLRDGPPVLSVFSWLETVPTGQGPSVGGSLPSAGLFQTCCTPPGGCFRPVTCWSPCS